MRKAACIVLTVLLLGSVLSACSSLTPAAQETPVPTAAATEAQSDSAAAEATPEAASIADVYLQPIDLFGEELNPFSDLELPEGYTPYMADVYLNGDSGTFALSYLADDPDVVANSMALIGITDADSLSQLAQDLSYGRMQETGTASDGREIVVTVKPVSDDGNYYIDASGYTVTVSTQLEDDMLDVFRQILALNINLSALDSIGAGGIADALERVDSGNIVAVTGSVNYVFSNFSYDLGDLFDLWNAYFQSDAYQTLNAVHNWGEENVSGFDYGNLAAQVALDPESKTISFNETLAGTAENIADYIPSASLVTVGFDKMHNYSSADGSVYIGIRKEIFGDTDEGDGVNFIQFSNDMEGFDCYLVRYYRPENRYYVQLQKDGQKVEYNYNSLENVYTPVDEQLDEAAVKATLQSMMNSDADMVLAEPIARFEQYIVDTFGMNSDALYELPAK